MCVLQDECSFVYIVRENAIEMNIFSKKSTFLCARLRLATLALQRKEATAIRVWCTLDKQHTNTYTLLHTSRQTHYQIEEEL